jgi:hypothetical protein
MQIVFMRPVRVAGLACERFEDARDPGQLERGDRAGVVSLGDWPKLAHSQKKNSAKLRIVNAPDVHSDQ